VYLSSAQNRRRRCCRKRAVGRKPKKERTNEGRREGGDPHACEKTRPPDVVAAPSSRSRRSELELRIPSRCRRGVFGLSVCLSVCRLHYPPPHLLTSITDPPHLDYFHYGRGAGGLGLESLLSFFLSLRACVSKGYVKVLKYTGALVSAYLSLTLISACPSLLVTLGDSMTDE
jgi:hypothetical protein